MSVDPYRLAEQAARAAGNGHPTPPPLELTLDNSSIEVGDMKSPTGANLKVIVVTHVSGGLRVVIPMPRDNARIVGNALCDRPNITLPG